MNDAIVAILPIIVSVVAILLSVVIHEFSHGVAAYAQGDPTPKDQGRLTLNPIPHIDPLGTLLIPGFLLLTGSPFLIGWARPMPFNPYNLRNARYGSLLVALAGPLSNFILFIAAGLLLKFYFPGLEATNFLVIFLAKLVLVNFVLGFFNMIPIPPLDGSKV
ncbi:site-2 protease family protein, partial [Candidatus Uhrbacteria bacterium]|nr:site-2 protease family protein [Candidatus Uhrbacteria bacterium]